MQKEKLNYAVVQVCLSSLQVLRYSTVSITEQLPTWQGCSCEVCGQETNWLRECVCVCQGHNSALKLLSKSVKQWGRVCILCEGCRARRAGNLASACLGNCLANHLPNVLSCCSLHFPDKVYMTGSYVVVFVAGNLGRHGRRRQSFGLENY